MDPTDDPFLTACRSIPSSRVPVWFMRQAGRSLPEYRAVRGTSDLLATVRHPELAVELTLQPVRRYGVDAAILFSDIVVPIDAIGFGVKIVPGRGPVIDRPIERLADLSRLRPLEPETDLAFVLETVRLVVAELDVPLIGFAGAPFTLASYLVEGGPTRTFGRTKTMLHAAPALWHDLMERLTGICIASLTAQIRAGAAAVQLFDSWAGACSPRDYERFVLPYSEQIFAACRGLGVPTIHFGVGTGELLHLMADAGPDVVGVDWRVPIDVARRRVGPGRAIQGNLDPALCLGPAEVALDGARQVLAEAGGIAGHVFNLGHGVLPETDPGVLAAVVELVHEEGRALDRPDQTAAAGRDR